MLDTNATRHLFYVGLESTGPSGLDATEIRRRSTAIMCKGFMAFSIHESTGYWEGVPEAVLIFEVVTTTASLAHYADELRKECEQETVLYTREQIRSELC